MTQPLIPRPFQAEGARWLAHQNGLLEDECGLGKTLTSLEACLQSAKGPILIICKRAAKGQWVAEIMRHWQGKCRVEVTGAAGRFEPDDIRPFFRPRQPNFFLIVHWKGVQLNWKDLAKFYWDVIVADEAHTIRNRKTLVSQALMQIEGRRRIALTATPQEKSVADRWNIYKWLKVPHLMGYWEWFENFVEYEMVWPTGGKSIIGTTREPAKLERLAEIMAPYTLRRTKAQVAPELPPLQHSVVPVELDPPHRELYSRLMRGELTLPEQEEPLFLPNHLAKLSKALQLIVAPHLYGFPKVSSTKLEWLDDYLTDNPTVPCVIASHFRAVATYIAHTYSAPLVVGGSNLDAARPFLEGTNRLLVGTIDALAESLNLQRASVMIVTDEVWSSTKMQQLRDRIHRMDITEPKLMLSLQAPKTYDLLVYKAHTEKWDDARIVAEMTERSQLYV